jgi:hypothetical protein
MAWEIMQSFRTKLCEHFVLHSGGPYGWNGNVNMTTSTPWFTFVFREKVCLDGLLCRRWTYRT